MCGFIAQVLIRVPFVVGRRGPYVIADEIGYLINARVISGGVGAHLEHIAVYRGGASLPIAPLYWITDDPTTLYRLVLAENVVLSALCFPVLVLVLRRAWAVPRPPAFAAAFVGCLYPPLLVTTQFAWTETLLPLLVLVYVALAAGVLHDSARSALPAAILLALVSGWLFAVHARMYAVLPVTIVVFALAWWRRRLSGRHALVAVVCFAAAIVAARFFNTWLADVNYGGRGALEADQARGQVTSLHGVAAAAQESGAQWWGVFVSSVGLAAVGAVAIGARAVTALRTSASSLWRAWRTEGVSSLTAAVPPADHDSIAIVIAMLCVTLSMVVALAFAYPIPNLSYVVYTRYIEPVAPMVIGIGLATLLMRRVGVAQLLAALGAVGLGALFVARVAGRRIFTQGIAANNTLGLLFFTRGPSLKLALLTVVSAAAIIAAYALGRVRVTAVVLLAGMGLTYVASASYRSDHYSGNPDGQVVRDGDTLDKVPAIRNARRIGIDFSNRVGLPNWASSTYQYYVANQRVTPIFTSVPSGVDVVVAPADWPLAAEVGAVSVWHDPGRLGWNVWTIGGSGRAAAARATG